MEQRDQKDDMLVNNINAEMINNLKISSYNKKILYLNYLCEIEVKLRWIYVRLNYSKFRGVCMRGWADIAIMSMN
jgi:hypothetical protein